MQEKMIFTPEEIKYFWTRIGKCAEQITNEIMARRLFEEQRRMARLIEMGNTPCWRYRVED